MTLDQHKVYRVMPFAPDYLHLSGKRVFWTGIRRELPYNGGQMVQITDNDGNYWLIREHHLTEAK